MCCLYNMQFCSANILHCCVCIVQQKGVDKEFFLLFSVMDENMSQYLEENIEMYGSSNTDPFDEDFEESNKMHGNQCFWYYYLIVAHIF